MECLAIVICLTSAAFLVSGLTLNKVPQCPYRQSLNIDSMHQSTPIQQLQEPQGHVTVRNNNPSHHRFTVHNEFGHQIPSNYQQHPGVSNAITDPTDAIIEHLRQHYINNVLLNPKGICVDSDKKKYDINRPSDSQVSKSTPDAKPQVVNNYYIVSPEYLQNKNDRTFRRQNDERSMNDRRNKAKKGTKRQRNDKNSEVSSLDSNTKSDINQGSTKKQEDDFHEIPTIDDDTSQSTTDDSFVKNNRFAVNAKGKKNRRKCKHRSNMRQKLDRTENTKPDDDFNEVTSNDNCQPQISKEESNIANRGLVNKLRTKVLSVPENAIHNFSSALKDELKKRKSHHNSSKNCLINDNIESCDNDLFMNTPSHNDKKRRIHRKTMKDENEELSHIETTDDEQANNITMQSQFQDQNHSWEVFENDANNFSIEEQLSEPEKDLYDYRCHGIRESKKILDRIDVSNDNKTTQNKIKTIKSNHKVNTQNLRKNKLLVQQRNNRNRFCKRKRPHKFEPTDKGSDNSKQNRTLTQNYNIERKKIEVESSELDQHIKTRPVLKIKSVTANSKGSERLIEESTTYKSVRKSEPENDDTATGTPKSEIETVYGHSKVVKYGSVGDDDTPIITYYIPENMQYEVDGKTVVIAKSIPVDNIL